ncbi:5210_t:CDS:1 [Scutellospora calospora]|uniref:5210_t:CDS:1 n=1 Tax=Scutellospora calospora TaxID=85575 RepID=A0ACA9LVB9_9GLOM|nr:5210_t:CDS:1 [Scutellospora calospora]
MSTTIVIVISHYNNLAQYKLTQQEDFYLHAITLFLKPFYETTNTLSSSTYIMLDLSILLIDNLIDVILSYIQNLTSPIFLKVAATHMLEKIKKYLNHIINKATFISSVLDPQIKLELMPVDLNTQEN